MLYNKNNSKTLSLELFENPTSEYRGAPFWAWNCELDEDMLLRQIEYLKEMGFGGFHMHSRSGMATEYLSDDFMKLVKACCKKAEEEGMRAYLYDEDRWPSGSAGGIVTKTKAYREKILVVSENPTKFFDKETGAKEGLPYLLAIYDIILDENGRLKEYCRIKSASEAKGKVRYAYVKTIEESGWYNNQTYVDTLSKEAMKKFIDVTYEGYKKSIGEYFGSVVSSVFTDEPQFARKAHLKFSTSDEDITFPWTTDFPQTYKEKYGEDILDFLPEVFWDLSSEEVSRARYCYHDHICDRFVQSFADQCGKWCDNNNIALTGHMVQEPTLESQTGSIGEAMRSYRAFAIPGIDMLCNDVELTTAKQAQSAVHQYGREAMISELYGVTNWDFDFKGHKFQGDWQAALGVTIRVPHLSWVSMKGSAKRDYPASINYQSPWFKDYGYIENHFARLNTVLTRGKPEVKVGVIHPIESFWLHCGPSDTGSDIRAKLDRNFADLTRWLLCGMVDFDFVSESLLPSQLKEITDALTVGEMSYQTIIVPGCETLRKTTVDCLKRFKENGGKLIFVGECPKYLDGESSSEAEELYKSAIHVPFERVEILKLLKDEADLKILKQNGETAENYIHSLRQDNDCKWLFIARVEQDNEQDVVYEEEYSIILNGEYTIELYNTLSGEIENIDYETKDGKTFVKRLLYPSDSLLLRLEEGSGKRYTKKEKRRIIDIVDFKSPIDFSREEDNVCVLDMASYSVDGGEYNDEDEIIRIDDYCRRLWGYPKANGCDAQPWVLGKDKTEHFVTLRFKAQSQCEEEVMLAAEEAEEIKLNGEKILLEPCGYYVDESIKKYKAGRLKIGENIIEIRQPIGKRTSLENCFLLGNFDVSVRGCQKEILPPKKKIGFGTLSSWGMPFYGGNLSYKAEINLPDCDLSIRVNRYRGAAVKVILDGKDCGIIAYKPYRINIKDVEKGKHCLEFKILGNRINTFGALHCCDNNRWFGPGKWYTFENAQKREPLNWYLSSWSYEYVLKETGILSSPLIEILEK